MKQIFDALECEADYRVVNRASFPSCFAVSDLAAAAFGAVGVAMARLIGGAVRVDQRLASLWFGASIHPVGWEMPPIWDATAGDYRCKDGWIRLHTNLPHHRRAALGVLGVSADRQSVADAVVLRGKDEVETAIVAAGGVAAAMRSAAEWAAHPQGKAVMAEPLIHWHKGAVKPWVTTAGRPLAGLKVLDLTRVIAGPVATRTLAGFGAEVLRIDPPGWDEPNVVPDVTLGKRCAMLSLHCDRDRRVFESLLARADVLVHGYRPDALAGLGYGAEARARIAPDLVEVALDAYGWSGPWAGRRGFDSLVQMSSGIADAGMRWAGADCPTPLPVQALDHATGYLMAAAVLRMLAGNGAKAARLSLARTGALLMEHPQGRQGTLSRTPEGPDFDPAPETTPWGPARRLRPALDVAGTPMHWSRAASVLGSSPAEWVN